MGVVVRPRSFDFAGIVVVGGLNNRVWKGEQTAGLFKGGSQNDLYNKTEKLGGNRDGELSLE